MDNDKSNRSIVNFAFVVAGALVYLAVGFLFETLADTFGPVAVLRANELAKHGLPIVAGFGSFLFLILNQKVHVYADECVVEIRKVVWPSRKDTVAMTIVCCVMCVVAGLGLGVFDFLASQLIKVFVH